MKEAGKTPKAGESADAGRIREIEKNGKMEKAKKRLPKEKTML